MGIITSLTYYCTVSASGTAAVRTVRPMNGPWSAACRALVALVERAGSQRTRVWRGIAMRREQTAGGDSRQRVLSRACLPSCSCRRPAWTDRSAK